MLYAVVIAIITGAALHSYSTLAQGAIDFFMGVTNTVAGDASTQKVQSIGNQLTNLTINGIKSALESVRDFSWSAKEVLLVLVDMLLTLIIGLFCMVMAMLMFVSVVSSIFTGTLMAGLAIALGPLFVATIASGFTKVFFDRWFGFFCSALFVKVVVMTMLTLLLGIFDAPTNTQNAVGQMNTGGFAFGKLLVLAVSLWIMKQLMEQAPNIASALMPGGLGVGVKGSLGTAVAAAAGVVGAGISAATGAASGAIAKAGGGANAAGMAAKANAAASSLATGAMNNAQKSAGLSPGSTQRSGPASPPPSQPTPAPTDQSLGKRSQTRNG
jgi:type IV secretion system protein TrbL